MKNTLKTFLLISINVETNYRYRAIPTAEEFRPLISPSSLYAPLQFLYTFRSLHSSFTSSTSTYLSRHFLLSLELISSLSSNLFSLPLAIFFEASLYLLYHSPGPCTPFWSNCHRSFSRLAQTNSIYFHHALQYPYITLVS